MYNVLSSSSWYPLVRSWGLLLGPPKPPFQTEQPLEPQLTGQATQPLTSLVALSWSFSLLLMPFFCWGESPNWMQDCRHGLTSTEEDNPFPPSTAHVPIDTAQDAARPLCCQGTPLAHVQLAVCQGPQGLFHRAALQPDFYHILIHPSRL